MALITMIPEDAVQNLAFAVIRQACFDYVAALPYESEKPSAKQKDIKECEIFFKSRFFAIACPNIEPEWLIKNLRKQRNFRSWYRSGVIS